MESNTNPYARLEEITNEPLLFEDCVELFLDEGHLSDRTRTIYAHILRRAIGYAPRYIKDIEAKHIEKFLTSQRVCNRTRNLYLAACRSFGDFLVEQNIKEVCVSRKVRPFKMLPPKQRVLTQAEYEKILTINTPESEIIIFLCNTGLRATEFCEASPRNVNDGFITVVGKGMKQRSIPLNKLAKNLIHVMEFSKNDVTLMRRCHKVAEQAGVERFSAHACRHYFATEMYRRGARVSLIAKLLGHSSSVVTERVYLHCFETEDLRGATDILDNRS